MKTQKHDRRSERTRRLLGQALVALMMERPYTELTVQDILDRADVGRSTFYAHYWDKDDLLTSEIERMVDALMSQIQGAPHELGVLVPSGGLFRHVGGNRRLYQALVKGGGALIALRAMRQRLCDHVERQLRAGTQLSETAVPVTAQVVVGTLLTLLQWWLESDVALGPDEMDAYYQALVMPGVRATIG